MLDRLMYNEYFLLNSYYPDLFENNRNPDAPFLKYDPEKARALLAEAGWKVDTDGVLKKDGKPFELVFLNADEPLPHLNIFMEDLKAVGIQARIEQLSLSTFTKRVDDLDFDMIWRNWGAGRLRDPEPMWHSRTADDIATQNISGVKNPEIDALIEKQRLEMDLGKRNEILRQIDELLVQIKPYILLWQSDHNRLLYWNRFGTPKTVLDKFNREDAALVYWWLDPEKERLLEEAQRSETALPALPVEVHYAE
jgi:microcin C transport system substrate-binding protein